MRYLLYCIFHSLACSAFDVAGRPEQQKPEPLLGVEGQPVFLVTHNSLSTAVSGIAPSGRDGACSVSTPDISELVAYGKVIESFHRDPAIRGVIPMRYGCLFEEESQISRFLEERGKEFEALLKDLEGCVEMGIRVLISDLGLRNADSKRSIAQPPFCNPQSLTSGQAYLLARRAYYQQEEQLVKESNELSKRFRAAFTSLFVKCKMEPPPLSIARCPSRIPVLSFYFLVPRKSLEPFRKVFRHISREESAKLLLSGPWPPYNFVLPHQTVSLPECFRESGQKGGFFYGAE